MIKNAIISKQYSFAGRLFFIGAIIVIIEIFRMMARQLGILEKMCRCSLMAKLELPKLASRVRFPSPAPVKKRWSIEDHRFFIVCFSRGFTDQSEVNQQTTGIAGDLFYIFYLCLNERTVAPSEISVIIATIRYIGQNGALIFRVL